MMTDQEIQRAFPGLPGIKVSRVEVEGRSHESATHPDYPSIVFLRSADVNNGEWYYEPLDDSEHRSRIEAQTAPDWKAAAEKRWLESARARVAETEKMLAESAPLPRHY